MNTFVAGLVLFFLMHFVSATQALRRTLTRRLGENAWKGVVTFGSLAGLALVIL